MTTSGSMPSQRLLYDVHIRQRDHQVGADDQAGFDLALRHQVDHLRGRGALKGQLRLGDAPHAGDVLAVFGHVDVSVAWQLVCLLADFAPALAVALAGQHRRAAAGLAHLAAGQRQVDAGVAGVHAVRAVLDAARMHDE